MPCCFQCFFLVIQAIKQMLKKCVGTLQEVLQGRSPTPSDIPKLPVCEAILLETLRLHPPAYMIGRCAASSTSLTDEFGKGFLIPKGTTALVAPYLLHRDSRWWTDAEQFLPARWLDPEKPKNSGVSWRTALSELGAQGTSTYLPFGGGPRSCIGTGFAMIEGFLVLAMIMQRWRLAPAKLPGQKAPEYPEAAPLITMQPQAVHVRLLTRVNNLTVHKQAQ
jgi:cytochrome P450